MDLFEYKIWIVKMLTDTRILMYLLSFLIIILVIKHNVYQTVKQNIDCYK